MAVNCCELPFGTELLDGVICRLVRTASVTVNGVEVEMSPAAALIVAKQLPASDPQKPVVMAYDKAYRERYKEDVSTFGGHAWDGLMILHEAIRRAGSTDREKVRDAIEATRNHMGTGGVVNFSANDHLGLDLSAFRMVEIRNGDWVLAN